MGALLAMMGMAAAQTRTVDDRSQPLALDAPPRRVVSLLPAITEMVCELGACDRLVGVDRHSNHPPRVQVLTRLGGLDDTPLETLLQLKPDVVLLAGSHRLLPRMQALGLVLRVFEPRDSADTERMGQGLVTLLGLGEATWQAHLQRQTEIWAELARQLGSKQQGQRVYVEVGEGPYVAAQSSFIGQALGRVNLQSAVPGAWGAFPRLSPEWVLGAQPDWIVLSANAPAASRRPGWSRLQAMQAGRVCVLNPAQMDTLVRPGPRLAQGVGAILSCMRAQTSPS
ncbi:MAG: helical backbone metal receptor [Alphaproteobacteria bacterium]|nr:helical backbone metal receptor [Alphaproteobacteria bacterium]